LHPLIPWFEPPKLDLHVTGASAADPPAIHAFAVLVLLAFGIGTWVAAQRAERSGLKADPMYRLVGFLFIGVFVGGHVGNELMYEPRKVLENPAILLKIWDGLASFGGFLACVPITVLFFRYEKLPFWKYGDCLAYGLSLAWFFARMGCFSAHDHPGTPTNFWLGVYGICPGLGRDVACHDMGLYEALWALGLFAIFAIVGQKPHVPGFFVCWLGIAYGPVRFAMDFLRPASTDTKYLGLTPAQYLSLLMAAACAALLVQRMRSGEPAWPTDAERRDAVE
jgi:phosphatidylglycerol:prolipoprotein diacylglycerol transferase